MGCPSSYSSGMDHDGGRGIRRDVATSAMVHDTSISISNGAALNRVGAAVLQSQTTRYVELSTTRAASASPPSAVGLAAAACPSSSSSSAGLRRDRLDGP